MTISRRRRLVAPPMLAGLAVLLVTTIAAGPAGASVPAYAGISSPGGPVTTLPPVTDPAVLNPVARIALADAWPADGSGVKAAQRTCTTKGSTMVCVGQRNLSPAAFQDAMHKAHPLVPDSSEVSGSRGQASSARKVSPALDPVSCSGRPDPTPSDWLASSRTSACRIVDAFYTVYTIVEGVPVLTGHANYVGKLTITASTGSLVTKYSMSRETTYVWGKAVGGVWSEAVTAAGSCVAGPVTPASAPIGVIGSKATYTVMVTGKPVAAGASTTCKVNWVETVSSRDAIPSTGLLDSNSLVRCDSAVKGKKDGCVIPAYRPALEYSQSVVPFLSNHILLAQGSGLPGPTWDTALTRTDSVSQDQNRDLACADLSSKPGTSCDEYPFASTQQGLATSGLPRAGNRRTFDGCTYDFELPTGVTGAKGISVCAINTNDQNKQGGLNNGFYKKYRVLVGDQFRVLVVP